MRTIPVAASRHYDVHVGRGLFASVGAYLARQFPHRRAFLISDTTVASLYAAPLRASLAAAGVDCAGMYTFAPGEGSKTLATVEEIYAALAEADITRTDYLVALGGGIPGDVTGFAAATYLRGIPFVQIPTTLLAAVDASVGGKTGVNFCGRKNQIGCFHQPSLVLCDPALFATLPPAVYREGLAEAVKCGLIGAPALFRALPALPDEEIVAACVDLKRRLVEKDEADVGDRRLLNLGHTVGHAVESATEGRVSHGDAVAIGTVVAARVAERLGVCKQNFTDEIRAKLTACGLPTTLPCPMEQLLPYLRSDKKRRGDTVAFVTPRAVGDCVLTDLPLAQLAEVLC